MIRRYLSWAENIYTTTLYAPHLFVFAYSVPLLEMFFFFHWKRQI